VIKAKSSFPRTGDIVAVPIDSSLYCLGVVLASSTPRIVTAFLERTTELNRLTETRVAAGESRIVLVISHGPLGFEDGWKIVGRVERFSPEDWPPLMFYATHLKKLIELDRRTLQVRKSTPAAANVAGLPEYGAAGSVYVEEVLAQIFGTDKSSR
jgi:hypothetical protein